MRIENTYNISHLFIIMCLKKNLEFSMQLCTIFWFFFSCRSELPTEINTTKKKSSNSKADKSLRSSSTERDSNSPKRHRKSRSISTDSDPKNQRIRYRSDKFIQVYSNLNKFEQFQTNMNNSRNVWISLAIMWAQARFYCTCTFE